MDIKIAFLQGDRYDDTPNVLTALPKEAGYPPHMAARVKKPAYGFNDAPRPTRGDRCTYVLYSETRRATKAASAASLEMPKVADNAMLD